MSTTAERSEPAIRLVPCERSACCASPSARSPPATGRSTSCECTRRASRRPSCGTSSPRRVLGANIPEEYGGGGLGMTGLAIVQEELARGLPAAAARRLPAIAGSILAEHGTREQQDRWLPGLARGTERISFAVTEADAGTNTHRITTRAKRAPTATGSSRARRRTSPASSTRRTSSSSRARRRGRQPRPAAAVHRRRRRARARPRADPDRAADARPAVDAVLRRRRGRRRPPGRRQDRRPRRALRRPQPGADHGRGGHARRRRPRAAAGRRSTRASARSGASRSAATRASATRWPRARSSSSSLADDAARRARSTTPAGRAPARRRTWPSTRRPRRRPVRRPGDPDPRRQRRRRSSTGSPTCGGARGCSKIAPVFREMILNYVAEHSLGLPKSY